MAAVMAEPLPQLRDLVAQSRWDAAIDLLRQHKPRDAANAMLRLPFEQQRLLFRHLPAQLAAALAVHFPYFHTYVLLYSLPTSEIAAIVDAISPVDREEFLDALPEESWQSLMKTLEEGRRTPAPAAPKVEEAVEKPVSEAPPEDLQPIIQAHQITKGYLQPEGKEIQVVAPMDLSVEPNTIIALLGPSGSGKSTILRMLCGLLAPSSGEVLWHGKPLRDSRPNVAIVFQSFALFPWLSVLENVEAPLLARGMAHAERHSLALKALEAVGLRGFEIAYPKELSGGMKQRVGFARALAVEPEILFMAEPFSALDVLTAENLRNELLELWLSKKMPTCAIFIVTHNIEEAILLADRVIVMGRNPGRVRADFPVELAQPRDRKSARFVELVDYVYKIMTQPDLALAAPGAAGTAQKPARQKYQMIPHARVGG